ncbi:uncharacterized protein LOC143837837 [Paroedura picta]|uniref:uncharacterized protein LOC143837837 n=1 Tax=Paroedura picta TaxID=143630 RepID=UPI004057501F
MAPAGEKARLPGERGWGRSKGEAKRGDRREAPETIKNRGEEGKRSEGGLRAPFYPGALCGRLGSSSSDPRGRAGLQAPSRESSVKRAKWIGANHPMTMDRVEKNVLKRKSGEDFLQYGKYHKQNVAAIEASYVVALRIARAMEPHTTAEDLLLPATKDIVRVMIGDEFVTKLSALSLSNDTVYSRIDDMSADILDQVIQEIKSAPLPIFSIQLDASTDIANCPVTGLCKVY